MQHRISSQFFHITLAATPASKIQAGAGFAAITKGAHDFSCKFRMHMMDKVVDFVFEIPAGYGMAALESGEKDILEKVETMDRASRSGRLSSSSRFTALPSS